jgi:hypothetical protein
LREIAEAKRAQKEAKHIEAALRVAEKKDQVYEAGADGFDLTEEPSVQPEEDGEKLTDNSPETRVEVRSNYSRVLSRLMTIFCFLDL